jgi:hypothetical protein
MAKINYAVDVSGELPGDAVAMIRGMCPFVSRQLSRPGKGNFNAGKYLHAVGVVMYSLSMSRRRGNTLLMGFNPQKNYGGRRGYVNDSGKKIKGACGHPWKKIYGCTPSFMRGVLSDIAADGMVAVKVGGYRDEGRRLTEVVPSPAATPILDLLDSPVVLKDSKKRIIFPTLGNIEGVKRLAAELDLVNCESERHVVTYGEDVVLTKTRRVFNDAGEQEPGKNLNHGGRQYAPWQSLTRAERRFLRIDGKKLVELDFSSIHITMALAAARSGRGRESKKAAREAAEKAVGQGAFNPYGHIPEGLEGEDKDLVKAVVKASVNVGLSNKNIHLAGLAADKFILNAAENDPALKEMLSRMEDSGKPVSGKKILIGFVKANPWASGFIGAGSWGVVFQRMESDLMMRVSIEAARQGEFVLILHDGLLCPQGDGAKYKTMMQRLFKEMFGMDIAVKEIQPPGDGEPLPEIREDSPDRKFMKSRRHLSRREYRRRWEEDQKRSCLNMAKRQVSSLAEWKNSVGYLPPEQYAEYARRMNGLSLWVMECRKAYFEECRLTDRLWKDRRRQVEEERKKRSEKRKKEAEAA